MNTNGGQSPIMPPVPSAERCTLLGTKRAELLKQLAQTANFGHRWARSSAGAAVSHAVAAGNALARARDLCDQGEWTRWARRNFQGSLRTAQRYMRLARNWPLVANDATRLSPESQADATRALRRALFGTERRRRVSTDTTNALPAGSGAIRTSPLSVPEKVPAPRVASLAVAGLDRLAASLRNSMHPGDAAAAYVVSRIESLAADLRLDAAPQDIEQGQLVYFAEAMGTDRVKIGVATDPVARLASLQTACPHPLRLMATTRGGRLLEQSLHARLAPFHIGGEWFYLADAVRKVIAEFSADEAAPPART